MKQELFKYSISKFYTLFHKDYVHLSYAENFDKDRLIFMHNGESNEEGNFVENFANQLCTVSKHDTMIVVESKGEDKVSIKVFYGYKTRRKGAHWFKVSRNVEFLTIDKKKGDIYTGNLLGYQRKRKFTKKLRRNYFANNPISQIRQIIISKLPNDRTESAEIADKAILAFAQNINPNIKHGDEIHNEIIKFYLETKKVKYPNNYPLYFNGFGLFPTLKTLRKHDMKLVEALMSDHQVKGDVIKRAIHSATNGLNLHRLKSILNYFPSDWVLQDPKFVKLSLDTDPTSSTWIVPQFQELTTKSELRCAFECFKQTLENNINWGSLYDHCDMYVYLKGVGENIKWKSKDHKSFLQEHLDWSDLYEFYKRGFYTRIYPQSLYDAFKIPIQCGDEVYYPVVLFNSDEYNHESMIQNNCVKTYIGRPSSIIISLRKESTISTERGTIEYQIFKKDGRVTFNRPQSLGKFNSWLSEEWNEPLRLLDERMEKYVGDGKKVTTVKIEKLLANHKTLHSDSDWAENGFLFWTYNLIDKTKSNYHLDFMNL